MTKLECRRNNPMTNDQFPRMDPRRKKYAAHAPFGHWCFVLPSSFVIRHSSFRGAASFMAALCLISAAAGCQGSYVNGGKGNPTEPEANYVPNDYQPKELSAWEQLSPENIGKTMKKIVGLGPNQKVALDHFNEGLKLFAANDYDKAAKEFA